MAVATTACGTQAQEVNLTISLSDISVLKELKKAIKLFRGVEKVKASVVRNHDITKTAGIAEAMEDKKNGRVYHAESVDDMFQQILG